MQGVCLLHALVLKNKSLLEKGFLLKLCQEEQMVKNIVFKMSQLSRSNKLRIM